MDVAMQASKLLIESEIESLEFKITQNETILKQLKKMIDSGSSEDKESIESMITTTQESLNKTQTYLEMSKTFREFSNTISKK